MKERKEARVQEFLRIKGIREEQEAKDAEERGEWEKLHPAMKAYLSLQKTKKRGI